MAEATGKGQENMDPFEELLELLHDEGLFEFPARSSEESAAYTFIEPSEAAKAIGKRVSQRVLARLGLTDVGSYVARERTAQKIKAREITRKIKLSREVLREIETSRLPFFELPFRKAADLVEALSLDSAVVLQLLGMADIAPFTQEVPLRLFRTARHLDKAQKLELEKKSLKSSNQTRDRQQKLEDFVRDFVEELSKRGILKR